MIVTYFLIILGYVFVGQSHSDVQNIVHFPSDQSSSRIESQIVSVAFSAQTREWKIIDGLVDFHKNVSDTNDNHEAFDVVVRANITNDQTKSGWVYLEIETNAEATDELQAEAAGFAEGYLTRDYIMEYYMEFFVNDICTSDPDACHWIRNEFMKNQEWIMQQVKSKGFSEPYWHQVKLIYKQMEGMSKGYQMKSEKMDLFEEVDIVMINFISDFWDLHSQYSNLKFDANSSINNEKRSKPLPSCSVLVKYLPDQKELFVAHNTWHEYRAMGYRLLKNYKLNFHTTPSSSEFVASTSTSMSSYVGTISSLDDFYLLSSGLVATETTLFVYDQNLIKNIKPEESVYEPVRVLVSNRLARNGQEWANNFKKFNSGTYNNQWMIIDYNIFKRSPGDLEKGVLTVLEQLPGMIVAKDQTMHLKEKSYWASYNRAFYPEIADASGTNLMVEEFGDWFTHSKTPRAKIFRRDHSKVIDLSSLLQLMRYNNFEDDNLAKVLGCRPLHSASSAIASRLDLAYPNQVCSFSKYDHMIKFSGYGALDAKMAHVKSFPSLEFMAIAGPTHNNQPVFSWANTNLPANQIPKFRPIETFNFEAINTTWRINGNQSHSRVRSIITSHCDTNAKVSVIYMILISGLTTLFL